MTVLCAPELNPGRILLDLFIFLKYGHGKKNDCFTRKAESFYATPVFPADDVGQWPIYYRTDLLVTLSYTEIPFRRLAWGFDRFWTIFRYTLGKRRNPASPKHRIFLWKTGYGEV